MNQEQPIWKYALASMLVTISSLGFGRMSYGILMPFMKESLSLTYGQAGMLATTNSIGYLGMVLFAGILAVKWGAKKLVVSGTFLVAFGLMYLATVQSFTACLVAMIVLGIGTAFTYTPLINIVVGWFPEKRGMMIGFLVSGLGLGTLISSLLIPFFTTTFSIEGWRYLWFLYGLLSLLCALSALLILRDPPVPLLNKEQKKQSLWKEVYLHKGIVLVAVIYGLIGFAYLIPQSFLFSFILESGIESYTAGQIMAFGGLMSIFSGPLWGAISDKIGRRKSLIITLTLGASSMLLPVFFPVFIGFVISQFVWGITVVGMLSLIQALSTEQIHPSYASVAVGYVTVYFASGQLLGPGLGGWMIDHVGGISSSLILCCGLLVLAFILSLRLKKKVVKEVSQVPVY
ncbi:YbfB/YjiJ family MFS transporter [Sporosarcina sp. G11-34]|uniref:YbfB/YjiJ family MFS transporter n=1 Tax=Sporosarcina sp. G11-34 TaxID=2849605 RepID=UPI0022A9DCE0|nr:YbfB/YjiJ family MFS transporter [Sporosarcina sp. G11-34]MCZ2259547.1 YbfB/YjiJ family MFS transporter [Sporosarcina sp. G11-34]